MSVVLKAGPILDRVASMLMIAASSAIIWAVVQREPNSSVNGSSDSSRRAESIDIAMANVMGSRNARVAVIEYGDFECKYCAHVATSVLPEFKKSHVDTGKALFVFKHFPLRNHRFAISAATAAECAAQQGKFWEMHHSIFRLQQLMSNEAIHSAAQDVIDDQALFASCLQGQNASGRVQADQEEARALQITGTPTFMVGLVGIDQRVTARRRVSGAISSSGLAQIVDAVVTESARGR